MSNQNQKKKKKNVFARTCKYLISWVCQLPAQKKNKLCYLKREVLKHKEMNCKKNMVIFFKHDNFFHLNESSDLTGKKRIPVFKNVTFAIVSGSP